VEPLAPPADPYADPLGAASTVEQSSPSNKASEALSSQSQSRSGLSQEKEIRQRVEQQVCACSLHSYAVLPLFEVKCITVQDMSEWSICQGMTCQLAARISQTVKSQAFEARDNYFSG